MPGFYFSEAPRIALHTAQRQQSVCGSDRTNENRHGHWVFDYSIAACGRVQAGEGPWLERPANVGHLYPPEFFYREEYCAGEPVRSAYQVFDAEGGALWRLADNPAGFARFLDPQHRIESLLFETIDTAAAGGSAGYFRSCGALAKLLDFLVARSWPCREGFIRSVDERELPPRPLATRVREYFERHYMEKITQIQLARELGIGLSTLAHRYRLESGETLLETLQRIRIEQSLPLLARGMRLKTVAEATGFANEFHYSRVFRRLRGRPPKECRTSC